MKPEFFRHEGLQDLEAANVGKYPMLVFAGLWGHCDKVGRFAWRPRMLKLDILPFLGFDMAETLQLLVDSGYIRRYSSDGGEYGVIKSFRKHQRINGKESQEAEKYPPEPTEKRFGSTGEAPEKRPESDGEAPETTGREGNGREGIYVGQKPDADELANQKKTALHKIAGEVVAFLNEKAGRNFDVNGANADHVLARLKDGETVDDLRAVIAMKVREWKGDPKMAEYLRPETLFNRTKFASYKGKLEPSNA